MHDCYDDWSIDKLKEINTLIEKKLSYVKLPTVIVLEIGHFMLPKDTKNLEWAFKNISFANSICENIIKKYKHKFKIIPTLLINNLEDNDENTFEEIIDQMLKDKKYINKKSLKIVSERNLKNRAFKALKNSSNLAQSFIKIDGKAYLKDDDYKHDLAAGFVGENGEIIPRCGLILTSYLDFVSKLSRQRLHQSEKINMLFISFSQLHHEYKRVMLGVDIYDKTHSDISIDPMVLHWNYNQDQCYLSFKPCKSKTWEDLPL